MNELESQLKNLITERYGSLKNFTELIGMPWTTLDSILKRGVANSNITNVLKITHELGIDAESLVGGKIVKNQSEQQTIAAHFDGEEFTDKQWERIKEFARFIKSQDGK